MITKIRENLYVGDDGAPILLNEIEPNKPNIILDLRGWNFDMDPMTSDDERWFIYDLIDYITKSIDREVPMLVHCHGGMDRSPFLIACWIWFDYYCQDKEVSGMYCYNEVKKVHPTTFIHDIRYGRRPF